MKSKKDVLTELSWKEIAAELCADLDNNIDEVAERLAKFAKQFDFSKENMRTLCDLDSSWVFSQIYDD
jgi:hypothetical protein